MKFKRMLFLLSIVLITASCKPKNEMASVSVVNPSGFDRLVETVEVPLADLGCDNASQIKVVQMPEEVEIPSQVIPCVKGDKLIFQVRLKANEEARFSIVKEQAQAYDSKAYAMVAKDRYNDFAWENDIIAYRMYHEKLIPVDGASGGLDIWSKSVRKLILDGWYAHKDYHRDHGEGCDSYKVGPTLGAGGVGFMYEGKLVQHSNYKDVEILANGPVRMKAKLTFPPVLVGEDTLNFVKVVCLDAGQNMNKYTLKFDKTIDNVEVAAGVLKRSVGDLKVSKEEGTLSYWQGKNKSFGHTGIAIVLKGLEKETEDDKHYMVSKVFSGDKFTYYSGACWSKANRDDEQNLSPDSQDSWESYTTTFSRQLDEPLMVEIQ